MTEPTKLERLRAVLHDVKSQVLTAQLRNDVYRMLFDHGEERRSWIESGALHFFTLFRNDVLRLLAIDVRRLMDPHSTVRTVAGVKGVKVPNASLAGAIERAKDCGFDVSALDTPHKAIMTAYDTKGHQGFSPREIVNKNAAHRDEQAGREVFSKEPVSVAAFVPLLERIAGLIDALIDATGEDVGAGHGPTATEVVSEVERLSNSYEFLRVLMEQDEGLEARFEAFAKEGGAPPRAWRA